MIDGILACLVLSLLLSLTTGASFAEVLVMPYTILIGVSSAVGSYIGSKRRALKKHKQ